MQLRNEIFAIFLSLRKKTVLQHIQIWDSCNSVFLNKELTLHLFSGNGTKLINSGESISCSTMVRGLYDPHILTLWQFTFTLTWNMASSLITKSERKASSSISMPRMNSHIVLYHLREGLVTVELCMVSISRQIVIRGMDSSYWHN